MNRMGHGRQVQLEMKIAARVLSSGISFRTETSQNAQLSRLRLLIFSETLQKRGSEKYFNWHSLRISIGILCENVRLVKTYLTKKKSFQCANTPLLSGHAYAKRLGKNDSEYFSTLIHSGGDSLLSSL